MNCREPLARNYAQHRENARNQSATGPVARSIVDYLPSFRKVSAIFLLLYSTAAIFVSISLDDGGPDEAAEGHGLRECLSLLIVVSRHIFVLPERIVAIFARRFWVHSSSGLARVARVDRMRSTDGTRRMPDYPLNSSMRRNASISCSNSGRCFAATKMGSALSSIELLGALSIGCDTCLALVTT